MAINNSEISSALSEPYAARDSADEYLEVYAREEARDAFWEDHDEDEYVCRDCDDPDPEAAIEVHHVDGDVFNNDDENLIGLCHEHHIKRHRRENVTERLREMRSEASEFLM